MRATSATKPTSPQAANRRRWRTKRLFPSLCPRALAAKDNQISLFPHELLTRASRAGETGTNRERFLHMVQNRYQLATALRRRLAQTFPSREGEMRPLGHAEADACLGGGLRYGTLHEIFPAEAADGATASGFVLALAMRITGNRK